MRAAGSGSEEKNMVPGRGTLDPRLKHHYLPSGSHGPYLAVTRLVISLLRRSE